MHKEYTPCSQTSCIVGMKISLNINSRLKKNLYSFNIQLFSFKIKMGSFISKIQHERPHLSVDIAKSPNSILANSYFFGNYFFEINLLCNNFLITYRFLFEELQPNGFEMNREVLDLKPKNQFEKTFSTNEKGSLKT